MEIKLFVATKAFILHKNKVLIIKESSKYSEGVNTGKFDVVGCRISPGEVIQEALKREVLEETGLDIKMGKIFFVNETRSIVKGESCQIIRIFFTCYADKEEVKLSDDHEKFLWINPLKCQELRNKFRSVLAQEFHKRIPDVLSTSGMKFLNAVKN